ncbi:MAG: ATP-binding domain-containing protein [Verrucomicrobia bacterium]|nr:ATP-binding domain-containing protein [Verrucomicrobiota bacterium]
MTLGTVHAAKGVEFDHVLVIGPWQIPASRVKQEEERRTFYVGITRARQTLTVIDRQDVHPSLPSTLADKCVIRSPFAAVNGGPDQACLDYKVLSLEDIHLGYPGQFPPDHPIHKVLTSLKTGDKLTMRPCERNSLGLFNQSGNCVSRLSRQAGEHWATRLASVREIRILAMLCRRAAQDNDEARRQRYQASEWQIPVIEVVFQPSLMGLLTQPHRPMDMIEEAPG